MSKIFSLDSSEYEKHYNFFSHYCSFCSMQLPICQTKENYKRCFYAWHL